MCWETRPLIGLKHIVCPAVLGREREIGVQNPSRIVYKLELRVCRASGAPRGSATDSGSTAHPACCWRVAGDNVAHHVECRKARKESEVLHRLHRERRPGLEKDCPECGFPGKRPQRV